MLIFLFCILQVIFILRMMPMRNNFVVKVNLKLSFKDAQQVLGKLKI